MPPSSPHALCQTLLHHGSGEDAVTQLSVSRQEFKEAYYAVENQIPGRTLDFEKLAQKDPIESDPLIAQGNLSILRLDDLYRETFQAWRNYSQGQELSANKRTIKPESPNHRNAEHRTDRSEKTEITTKQTTPDATLINQAVNIVLASFRIQATLTHRLEQLISGKTNNDKLPAAKSPPEEQLKTAPTQQHSRELASISGPKSQPEAEAPLSSPAACRPPGSCTNAHSSLDYQEKPIQKIRGLNRYTKLTAYKTLAPAEPLGQCQQHDTPSPVTANNHPASLPPDHCSSKSSSSAFIPAKNPPKTQTSPNPKIRVRQRPFSGSEPEPYIELPSYQEISSQLPEVQEFLARLKQEPTYTNTS